MSEDPTEGMTRAQRRQFARALGWRGTRAGHNRKYFRPDLAPTAIKIVQERLEKDLPSE